ncbi:MAG: hypothetical protein AAFV88_03995 [Planctomycetota bacterium]
MSFGDTSDLIDRLRFFDGQRLFASDLQAIDARHQTMRELHNRTLHQAGIGYGLIVTGAKGQREVQISPGYAIDACGHEIILIDPAIEPVPPVNADPDGQPVFYDLTVSYRSADQLEDSQLRQGVCSHRPGVIRLREQLQFCWVRLERDINGRLRPREESHAVDILQRSKIILSRIEVRNCQIASVSAAVRHDAAAQGLRYVTSGEALLTDALKIRQDEEITENHFNGLIDAIGGNGASNNDKKAFGLVEQLKFLKQNGTTSMRTSRVPTDSAGFSREPCYTASIRIASGREFGLLFEAVCRLMIDMLSEVQESHSQYFKLRHPVWRQNGQDSNPALLSVAWTGIE